MIMGDSTADLDVNEAAANARKLALSTNSAAPWSPYVFDFYSQVPPPFYQNNQLGSGGLNFTSGSNFAPPPIPQLSMQQQPRHPMSRPPPNPYRPPLPFYNNFSQPPPRFPASNPNSWGNSMNTNTTGNNEEVEVVERVARNPIEGPKPIRFSLNPTGRKNKPTYNQSQGQGGLNNSNNNVRDGVGNKQHVNRFGPPIAIAPLEGTVMPLPDPYTTQIQNSVKNQGGKPQESGVKYGLASGSSWATARASTSNVDVPSSSNFNNSLSTKGQAEKKDDAESACINVENWSPSLKKYAEEWFTAVFTTNPDLADHAQELLRKKLEAAYRSGEFRTKDWSKEPLPFLSLPTSSSLRNGYSAAIPGTVKGTPLKPDVFPGGRGRGRGGRGGRSRTSPFRGESFKSRQTKGKGIRGRNCFRSNSRSWSRSRSRSSSSTSSEDTRGSKKRKRNNSGSKYGKKKKMGKKEKGKNGKKNNKDKKTESQFYSEYGAIGGGVAEDSNARLNARAARFAKDEHKSPSNKNSMKSRLGGFVGNSSNSSLSWSIDSTPSYIGGRTLASWDMNSRIVGTSMDLEKMYLRLTTAPDPSTIRPVHILKKSLKMVCDKWKESEDYRYTCDQLKAIRQDLTVQRVRDSFTILVYETHARIALEKGDHEEFNQCQSQLVQLYDSVKSGKDNQLEFMAYRIFYYIFTASTLDLGTVLGSLSDAEKEDECIAHALRIHSAWAIGNYSQFFKLRKESPKMSGYLIDWFMNRERKLALKKILKSYRQTVPKSFLISQLDLDGEKGWNDFLKVSNLEQAIVYSDPPHNTKINAKDSQAFVFAVLKS